MTTTSWLIGSYKQFPAATFDVEDELASSESQSIATGDYYPYDTSSSRSLLAKLVAAVNLHTNISDCAGVITKSGRLKIHRTGGSNFAIKNMPSTLASLLGFSTSLTGASSYVAATVSPRFWSPGKQVSSRVAPAGVDGQKVRDAMVSQAATGTLEVVTRNSYRVNEFFWRYLPVARVWTASENNGEWQVFHDQVIAKGEQWKIWTAVDEDTSDTSTAVTLGAFRGPYIATDQIDKWGYQRELPNVDRLSRVELRGAQVPDL